MKRCDLIALASFGLALAGCAATGAQGQKLTEAAAAEPAPVASVDPRVKFKDGDRYLRDLANALEIPRESVCLELGQYDCFSDAFRIVLGGVEAANLLVNEPLEVEALTAPIAYDRLALNVCTNRVDLDVSNPGSAVLFKSADDGGPRKPGHAWLEQTANGIYASILRRDPAPAETAQLVAFYDEIAANAERDETASRDWTVLSCFAVASSMEAIFY